MKNIKVIEKDGIITIEIPVKSILKECKNEDWQSSHSIGEIENKDEMTKYLVEILQNPLIETGNGDVTPIENFIMDVLSEAYSNGEDFFKDEENEE